MNEEGSTALTSSTADATARLLWHACRWRPEPADLQAVLAARPDMDLAVAAAIEHRIAPLLWRSLREAGALDALGDQMAALQAVSEVYRMEAALLLPRAVALAVGPLMAAGLEPVVLKGPAVAARYPEPGLRPMEDIDLLLPHAQHAEALRALVAARWRVVRPTEPDAYDTVLTHGDVPSLALELHYGVESPSQRVTTIDAARLWSRREPIDCLGTAAFGLPFSEELTFLCAHAGKPHHGFFRVIWIADLAMIIGRREADGRPIEWAEVRATAEENGSATVVAAGLAMARHAGVAAPPELFPLPSRGWRGSAMRQLTAVSWPLTHLELPGYHLNYALADTVGRRMRILLVLRGSGHGIGKSFRRAVAWPRRRLRPARAHRGR